MPNYLKVYLSCYSLMTELTPLVQKLMGEEYISLKYACMIDCNSMDCSLYI